MNDLKPHQHGDEGIGSTHSACNEMLKKFGGKATCCQCNGHKCEPSTPVSKVPDSLSPLTGTIIQQFDELFFISGKNAYGQEVPMLYPSKTEIRNFIHQALTRQREAVVKMIEETRNAIWATNDIGKALDGFIYELKEKLKG